MDPILQLFKCPPSPPTFNIGLKPPCTFFILTFDGQGSLRRANIKCGGCKGVHGSDCCKIVSVNCLQRNRNQHDKQTGSPLPDAKTMHAPEACVFSNLTQTRTHSRPQPQRPAKNDCHSTATRLPLDCHSIASRLPLLIVERNECPLEGLEIV